MNATGVPPFDDPSLPLSVVVAGTRWEEPPRIRHQVTRQLMRWCNVLFVELFPDPRHRDRAGFRRHGERLIAYTATPRLRWPIRLYANDPVSHSLLNRQFVTDIMSAVSAVKRTGLPLLFNFVYDLHEIMRRHEFIYKAYVCYDEFPKMQRRANKPNRLKWFYQTRLFQQYEDAVARNATRCLTPHYPLRQKLLKIMPRVDMLFHAHEFDPQSNAAVMPCDNSRTHVGFAGFINWRLLPTWLEAVAESKDMKLHLIGPVEGRAMVELVRHPAVEHVSTVGGDRLLGLLRGMDVLVMPYDPAIEEVSVLTTNSKTFQYVAAGRPCVISDLPHYINLPRGVLYKAKSAAAFVEMIRSARAEDCDEYRALRARIARDNTWDKRGETLWQIIQQDLSARGRNASVLHQK